MVPFATASAAKRVGNTVPAGDAVNLVADQAGDGRLVIAEIGDKTGEAVGAAHAA